MKKVSKKIAIKLCALFSFLHQTSEEFETVAEEIKDNKIKMTLRGLAIETRQYEHELNSQLQSLRIKDINLTTSDNVEVLLKNIHFVVKEPTEEEIFDTCRKSEASFNKEYRNVLNEYFPYPDLKSMLVYQLNGIKCAFMKIKLLNSISHGFNGFPPYLQSGTF
jgi:hypothetical protein